MLVFRGAARRHLGVVLVKIIGLDVAHRHTDPPGDIHGRSDHFFHNAPGFFGGLRPAHARDVVDVDLRAIRQSHIPAVQTNECRAFHWQLEDVLCVAGFVYGQGTVMASLEFKRLTQRTYPTRLRSATSSTMAAIISMCSSSHFSEIEQVRIQFSRKAQAVGQVAEL